VIRLGRFLWLLPGLGLVASVVTAADAANTNYVTSRAPLASTPYVPLPLGSIRAKGWLLTQLQLQKTGLTGNAESIYDDLAPNSGWLGGNGSNWERPPYYLRGLIPLAYTLNDAALKTTAQKWMDWAINSAQPSGYFGPLTNTDWWGHMPILIALEDYYEATNDARVLTLLANYFNWQKNNDPGGLGYWGAARAADNILAVQWLYNRNGDSNLLTFMDTLRTKTEDWTTAFTNGTFGDNHGVNVAEGFKMPPVCYLRSLSATDKNAFMLGITNGQNLHGQAHYALSCTEFLAGKSSLQGPELCSIVDKIFSNGVAMNIIGDPKIGDVTEKLAFNALPGCLSKTSRQHQYYDLPNQAQSLYGSKGIFGQDYENALCPSWYSGVGCCSLNWHEGWPKFTQYSWAATSENGLAIFTYAPTEVTALVGSGVSVKFTEDTNYPFEQQIRLSLTTSQSVAFPLEVRIPEWCASPSVKVNGIAQSGVTTQTFYKINRTWANGDTVTLDFPMPLKATPQFNNSVAIEMGPLVYSLQIGENWVQRVANTVNGLDFGEYEVKPTTNWNYGLIVDPANPSASITVNQRTMPSNPFVQSTTPITLTARAKLVPTWTMAANGLPNEVPPGPVTTNASEEAVTLVPFGAENIRITYFPQIAAAGFAGGLTGQYYSDKTLTALAMTRVDPSVNFDWGASSPGAGIGGDNFSVRWSGQVKPRYSGTYTFYVTSDDGRRLWVNGTQIINTWTNTSGTYTGTISLTAGSWYDIKLEYYENTLTANAKLEWSSSSQTREVIPPSCLRPAASASADVIYAFDEATGTTTLDLAGNGRDGTLMNGAGRALGKSGNAVSLDGVDDYVSVPSLGSHSVMTATAWVKLDSLDNARNAIFNCGGWSAGAAALTIANTGEVIFSVSGASAEDQVSLSKITSADFGKWKHVAVIYDTAAKTAKFYIDGQPDTTRSYTGAPTILLNNIRIGSWDGGGRNLRGKIDDFRIYSRALSDGEIAALGDTGEVHGLRSQYYDNSDLSNLKLVRTDANINFNWGTGSPDASIGADTFSVRWTGKLRPRCSELYTFYTTTDDGVRLWVNGQKIIDGWVNGSSATERSGTIRLVAGRKYDVKMEYYENTGSASAKLEWASASQPREVVPASCIFGPEDYLDPSFAWYKFDETSGATVNDSSGNGRNGTMTGGYTRVMGKFGNAINLDGSSGYAVLPTGLVQTLGDFSITAWVKLDANDGWNRLFDFGTGTAVNMFLTPSANGGPIRYAITTSGSGGEQQITGSAALPTGSWQHVAVTLSGTTGTLYVNGIQVGLNTGMSLKPSSLGSTTQNWIGRSQYSDPYLDGTIDDFRIYGWGLTATEVAAMAADRPDNCIGYLKKYGTVGGNVLLVNKVITWVSPGAFYIQCPETGHTGCGIKVVGPTTQAVGSTVTVSGTLARDTNGELIVNSAFSGPGMVKDMPKSMGVVNKTLGGGNQGIAYGPTSGVGFNTIGVVQTAWGKARNVVDGQSMVVDDGSTRYNPSTHQSTPTPVTVYGPIHGVSNGNYVRVTGVAGMDSSRARVMYTRSDEDVVVEH